MPDPGKIHDLEDIFEERHKLTKVATLDGPEVANDMDLNPDAIVQEDAFDDDPDEEDYGGFMGNSVSMNGRAHADPPSIYG